LVTADKIELTLIKVSVPGRILDTIISWIFFGPGQSCTRSKFPDPTRPDPRKP